MDQYVDTSTKDGSLLENQILKYLSQKTEPYTCVQFIFAWLKGEAVLEPNESKKRLNQALNSLTKRKMIVHKIINGIPMYRFLSNELPKKVVRVSSPPQRRCSNIPVGYIMADLMPDTFVSNQPVEQCTKLWLDHFKTQMTSGVARDHTTSKIRFEVHTQTYYKMLEENHTGVVVAKAFSKACRAMKEIGWNCHVSFVLGPPNITLYI